MLLCNSPCRASHLQPFFVAVGYFFLRSARLYRLLRRPARHCPSPLSRLCRVADATPLGTALLRSKTVFSSRLIGAFIGSFASPLLASFAKAIRSAAHLRSEKRMKERKRFPKRSDPQFPIHNSQLSKKVGKPTFFRRYFLSVGIGGSFDPPQPAQCAQSQPQSQVGLPFALLTIRAAMTPATRSTHATIRIISHAPITVSSRFYKPCSTSRCPLRRGRRPQSI